MPHICIPALEVHSPWAIPKTSHSSIHCTVPSRHFWFPGPGEDNLNKETKYFPVLSLFYHFFVARQKHLSNLKRAARPSHPCETLPGCGWKCLCKPSGGHSLTWEPLSASEEEISWFTKSLAALQCLSDLDSPVSLLAGRQPQNWPCWPTRGSSAHCLWQWARAKASRRTQKQREADSSASQSPGMPQGGISELPPSWSLCLPISFPPE